MSNKKKVRVNVYLEPEVDEVLRAVSVLTRRTISDLVNQCVQHDLYTILPHIHTNEALTNELRDKLFRAVEPPF